MRPIAHADRHDFLGHVDELVPSKTEMVENVVVAVREPKIAALWDRSEAVKKRGRIS